MTTEPKSPEQQHHSRAILELESRLEVLTTECNFWKDIAMRAVPFLKDHLNECRHYDCRDEADEVEAILEAVATVGAVGEEE